MITCHYHDTDLVKKTISIRIAGIDAPEMGWFNTPRQPGATEAHEWLASILKDKSVWVEIRGKDQYKRVVGVPYLPSLHFGWLSRGPSVALKMLRAGHANVYRQAGAEYGSLGIESYEKAEKEAKLTGRGIWAHENVMTSAEWKQRYPSRHRSMLAANTAEQEAILVEDSRGQSSDIKTPSIRK
jgi:endonuclease YncB( thermonuclease family)